MTVELGCLSARSTAGRAFPSRLHRCGRSERRRGIGTRAIHLQELSSAVVSDP